MKFFLKNQQKKDLKDHNKPFPTPPRKSLDDPMMPHVLLEKQSRASLFVMPIYSCPYIYFSFIFDFFTFNCFNSVFFFAANLSINRLSKKKKTFFILLFFKF
jgi:hypothetical protein